MKALSGEDLWTSEREVVEISFPGSVDFVVIARFTAATVGARAGFDLDDIDDLRLAVDELSISFGPLDTDSCLRYEFIRDGDSVMVRFTREPVSGHGAGSGQRPGKSARQSQRELANWMQAGSFPPFFSTNSLPRMAGRSPTDAPSHG